MFVPVHVPARRSPRPGSPRTDPQKQVAAFLMTLLAAAVGAIVATLSELAKPGSAGLSTGKAVVAGLALTGLSAGLGLALARGIGRRGKA